MKLSNGQIYGVMQALGELSQLELPVKLSYWMARLINKLDSANKAIEKVRSGLVQKYGKATGNNQFAVNQEDEGWEQFAAEFNELMMVETEVDVSPVNLPLKLPLEVAGKPLLVKTSLLTQLEGIIEVEDLGK